MPVPSGIENLSVTAASNDPAGTENANTADDHLRAIYAFLRQTQTKGSDIASAATVTPGSTAASFDITGTTGISAIGSTSSWDGRRVLLQFDGALTLTHSASLILPGAANIVTAAGDRAEFWQEGSGVWRCLWYTRAQAPSFYVWRGTTAQTSGTTILYNQTNHNNGSNYVAGTGVFTAPIDGVYSFHGQATVSNQTGTTQAVTVSISANISGSAQTVSSQSQSITTGSSGDFSVQCQNIRLTALDTVQVAVTSLSANLTVTGNNAGATLSRFSGRYLGN